MDHDDAMQREAERRIAHDYALQQLYAGRAGERTATEGRPHGPRPEVTPALRAVRAAGGHQVLTDARG